MGGVVVAVAGVQVHHVSQRGCGGHGVVVEPVARAAFAFGPVLILLGGFVPSWAALVELPLKPLCPANAGVVAPGYVTPWAAPGMPTKVLMHLLSRHAPVRLARPMAPGQWGWMWHWCWGWDWCWLHMVR